MAIKGRTWSKIDTAMSDLFARQREEHGNKPMRDIAEETGLTYSRVRDILNKLNGTPTLREFMILCAYYELDPAATLGSIEGVAGMSDVSDYALVANRDPDKLNEAGTPDV